MSHPDAAPSERDAAIASVATTAIETLRTLDPKTINEMQEFLNALQRAMIARNHVLEVLNRITQRSHQEHDEATHFVYCAFLGAFADCTSSGIDMLVTSLAEVANDF